MADEIIVINSEESETQVAVMEGSVLEEFYTESKGLEGMVGNIYKGRVTSVLPGMNAAFVDIGEGKNGFLYADEAASGAPDSDEAKDAPSGEGSSSKRRRRGSHMKIDSLIKKGQEVLIQVEKDAYGTKGPRITTQISIPGRKLVFMPYSAQKGISRRIEDAKERMRLKDILNEMKLPEGAGIIIRTQGAGYMKKDFEREIRYLLDVWKNITNKTKKAPCPSLIHKESGLIMRIVRDIFSDNTAKFSINSKSEFRMVYQFVRSVQPNLKSKMELYRQENPIFENFGIGRQMEKMYERKVFLKSGGYITIEQTEGLVAIDVNTGKFTGRRGLEETVTKTNMEAAKEIARQLRLRDMGGIIVIDFIDMEQPAHRKDVALELEKSLERDRAKTEVFGMSPLCLIEMTRQRIRRGIEMISQEPCPYCGGKGAVKSKEALCAQAIRKLKNYINEHKVRQVEVILNPEIAQYLLNEKRNALSAFEQEKKAKVVVQEDKGLHIEDIRIKH